MKQVKAETYQDLFRHFCSGNSKALKVFQVGHIIQRDLISITLSSVGGQEPFAKVQDKPDHKGMWEELLTRPDTSLALHDVMEEIETSHTPDSAKKPEGKG